MANSAKCGENMISKLGFGWEVSSITRRWEPQQPRDEHPVTEDEAVPTRAACALKPCRKIAKTSLRQLSACPAALATSRAIGT
jgi:hypothetical protein